MALSRLLANLRRLNWSSQCNCVYCFSTVFTLFQKQEVSCTCHRSFRTRWILTNTISPHQGNNQSSHAQLCSFIFNSVNSFTTSRSTSRSRTCDPFHLPCLVCSPEMRFWLILDCNLSLQTGQQHSSSFPHSSPPPHRPPIRDLVWNKSSFPCFYVQQPQTHFRSRNFAPHVWYVWWIDRTTTRVVRVRSQVGTVRSATGLSLQCGSCRWNCGW